MAARFEKSIDVSLSEDSLIVEKWDSESVETPLKVNIQK